MTETYESVEQEIQAQLDAVQADIDAFDLEFAGLIDELDIVKTLDQLQEFNEKKAVMMEKQQLLMMKRENAYARIIHLERAEEFIPKEKTNMPYPDMLELDYNRYVAIQRLNTEADNFVNNATLAQYPEFERQTFEIQKQEALAWAADNSAATPKVDLLAQNRGVDREILLAKILEKVEAFEIIAMTVAGQRQKYEDQIKAMTDTSLMQTLEFVFTLGE